MVGAVFVLSGRRGGRAGRASVGGRGASGAVSLAMVLLVDVYEIRRCGRSDCCSLGLAVFILFLRSFELDMADFLIGVKVLHIGRLVHC